MRRTPSRRSSLALVAVAGAAAVAGIGSCGGGDGGGDPGRGAPPPAGTAALRSMQAQVAGPGGMRVAYRGSRRLAGRTTLLARVSGARTRVVAVTYTLDGRPLGSATSSPYALDVEDALLPRGRHRLRAVAVDRNGRRARSAPVAVSVGGRGHGWLSATPQRGLARALAALRRGGVTVRFGPGRYPVAPLHLGSGARLIGAGPATVIVPNGGAWAALVARGRAIRVSDLAIDGVGRAGRGAAVAPGSRDVRLQRLSISGFRQVGVEAWGAHAKVSVQDSVIEGNGAEAGVLDLGSEHSRDVSVIRTRIAAMRGYGVNFAQRFYGRRATALHNLALDNVISDITDPSSEAGTHEGGIWTGGVAAAIIGNHIRATGIDGVETVGSSTGTTVVANDIADTPVGIYLEHSTYDSLIARNRIADVRTGINVEWRHDGGGSGRNVLSFNRIADAQEFGLFLDVGSDGHRVIGNTIVDGGRPAIVLQGTAGNLVERNRACGTEGPLIGQQNGRWEDGRLAQPHGNRLVDNSDARRCGS